MFLRAAGNATLGRGRVSLARSRVPVPENPRYGAGMVTLKKSAGLVALTTGRMPLVLLLVPSTVQSQPLPTICRAVWMT